METNVNIEYLEADRKVGLVEGAILRISRNMSRMKRAGYAVMYHEVMDALIVRLNDLRTQRSRYETLSTKLAS